MKKSLNILPSFTCVATLPCKTVVLKNRKLHCRNILQYITIYYKRLMTINNYTIISFAHFSVKLVNESAYGQCVTKNDVQNVHRQPAHQLTNDDATDESLP